MKIRGLLLLSIFLYTFCAQADEDCESSAIQVPASDFVRMLKVTTEGLYRDITGLEVKYDGKGKLSIFYENGIPKLLKMTYTNGKGVQSVAQKSFDDIEASVPLIYENKEKPGKSIIVERGGTFKVGTKYHLVMKIRSSLDPDKYTSYPIVFDSDMSAPKLSSNGKDFNIISITPGVRMFSWDGTFKKVDFKN